MHRFLFSLLFTALACTSRPVPLEYKLEGKRVLEPVHRAQAAQFVIDCARAANPHSDEEGEDLVAQCEHTSRNFYTTYVPQCAVYQSFDLVAKYNCTAVDLPEPCKAVCPRH